MSHKIDTQLPLYTTRLGEAYVGDSLVLLDNLRSESINLVLTSPPFALLRQKEYGNESQSEYVEWLSEFAVKVKRVLTPDGSFVLDLGGAYQRGRPVRCLYNYRILLHFVDELKFNLAEEFFWHNPAKLPSPIEWVNKRKIRVKDSVNTVWWFSKSDFPKADVTRVLVPYSARMRKLLENPLAFYKKKKRPSGHEISRGFDNPRSGAIPPNLLQFANTTSNSLYMRLCKMTGAKRHPARFPLKLPEFFVKFLTDPGDTVLDIFAGSNTTGEVAQELGRQWIAFEMNHGYLCASAFRFLTGAQQSQASQMLETLSRSSTSNQRLEEFPLQDKGLSLFLK